MEENDQRDLESLFAQVQDPRLERTQLHRLRDSIILAICGVLCGAEQKDGLKSKSSGKRKKPFLRNCSVYPMVFPLMRRLAGSLPCLIRNSLKPVLCNGSRESAKP